MNTDQSAPERTNTLKSSQALLEALAQLAPAEERGEALLARFWPHPLHGLFVRSQSALLLGHAGTGKRSLARVLCQLGDSAQVRVYFDSGLLPKGPWVEGFGDSAGLHPPIEVLDCFTQYATVAGLRAFWLVHMLRRLRSVAPELVASLPPGLDRAWQRHTEEPGLWIQAAERAIPALFTLLDQLERALKREDRSVTWVFSDLESLGAFALPLRERLVRSLLMLWHNLAERHSRLRAKILMQPDLIDLEEEDSLELRQLLRGGISLEWDRAALWSMAVRGLAQAGEPARAFLRRVPGIALQERGPWGSFPLPIAEAVQEDLARRLVELDQEQEPASWLWGQIQDGQGRVLPGVARKTLAAAASAALERSAMPSGSQLSAADVEAGLTAASELQIGRLEERYPGLKEVNEGLSGLSLPIEEKALVRVLAGRAKEDLGIASKGAQPEERRELSAEQLAEGRARLAQLIDSGVLVRTTERRIDMSVLYQRGYRTSKRARTSEEELLAQARGLAPGRGGALANRLLRRGRDGHTQAKALPAAQAILALDRAEALFEESARLRPDGRKVWLAWCDALMERALCRLGGERQRDFKRATMMLQRGAQDLTARLTAVWYGVVQIASSSRLEGRALIGSLEAPLEALLNETQRPPLRALIHHGWSQLLGAQAQLEFRDRALALLDRAVEKARLSVQEDPSDADSAVAWSNLLQEKVMRAEKSAAEPLFLEVRERFEDALRIAPEDPSILEDYGDALVESGHRLGGDAAAPRFVDAINCYRCALLLKPTSWPALTGWGGALVAQAGAAAGEERAGLLLLAEEKFRSAYALVPESADALERYGWFLLQRAQLSTDDPEACLQTARDKLLAATTIRPTTGAFNLACVFARLGDEAECRRWLEVAAQHGDLKNPIEDVLADPDLQVYADRPWFLEALGPP